MARSSFSSGVIGLALGRDLADQDVARRHFGADADDAVLVEVLECVFAHVGDVARDLFGAEFGLARIDFVLLDVDRGVFVVLHQPFADQDRIFKVAAFPAQVRDQHILAEGQLAVLSAGAVRQHVAGLDHVALEDDGALVDAGALVGAVVLAQGVDPARAVRLLHHHRVADHADDFAVVPGRHHLAGIDRGLVFHAGADDGCIGAHQRHGLALHVGTHQRAIGVVVLQEGNQRRRDAHDLLGRHVHVAQLVGLGELEGFPTTGRRARVAELADRVHRRRRLRNGRLLVFVGGQEDHVAADIGLDAHRRNAGHRRNLSRQLLVNRRVARCDHRPGGRIGDIGIEQVADEVAGRRRRGLAQHAAIGRLDEAEIVDAGKGGQRTDQTDVRTFGRLDRADAAVVAEVHVAHVEAGALAAQTAGTQRAQAALVGQFGQRVGLVHELAQLAAAEELAGRRHDGADVDQAERRHLVGVANGHALAHDPLHAQQTDAQLILDQLAHGLDAAVAQVVDVVGAAFAVVDQDDALDHRHQIFVGEDALFQRRVQPQAAVQLIAAHLAQVVATRREKEILHEAAGVVERGRIARAQLLVELQQRVVDALGHVACRVARVVTLQRRLDEGVIHVRIDVGEEGANLVVGAKADGAQQQRHRQLALAVNLDADNIALAGLEFQPGAARGDHLGAGQVAPGAAVGLDGEVDARGANQLADDDALAAVNNKGGGVGHQREVAHKDFLLADLTGLAVEQLDLHPQRGGKGDVALAALLHRILWFAEVEIPEVQFQRFVETGDRRNFSEQFLQSLGLEPVKTVDLHLGQPWQIEDRRRPGIAFAISPLAIRGHIVSVCGLAHVIQLLIILSVK